MQQRAESRPAPPADARKQLAARLISLGAIPIAVFCAVYVVVWKIVGITGPHAQAWALTLSLAGSFASLVVLASLYLTAGLAIRDRVWRRLHRPAVERVQPIDLAGRRVF